MAEKQVFSPVLFAGLFKTINRIRILLKSRGNKNWRFGVLMLNFEKRPHYDPGRIFNDQ